MARQNEQRPICLILDFDGTLTKRDTMHVVAEAGYRRQKELKRSPQPRPWNEIVDAYMDDFRLHTKAYSPAASHRTTIAQEIAWLNSLEPIEQASIHRALEAGIFDDVRDIDMKTSALESLDDGDVQLRPGFAKACHAVYLHNANCYSKAGSIHVLSVNWSFSFIRHVWCLGLRSTGYNGVQWSKDVGIHANELPSIIKQQDVDDDEHEVSQIRTSGDKVKVLMSFASRIVSTVIYVGDSTTDLECLLVADIGICIRDDPMGSGQRDLAETCDKFNIDVLPLRNASKQDPIEWPSFSNRRSLYFIHDFSELQSWIEGLK